MESHTIAQASLELKLTFFLSASRVLKVTGTHLYGQ